MTLLCLTSCTLLTSHSSPIEREATANFFAMDTFITLTVYGNEAELALTAAKKKILELENIWSVTNTESEIYAINNNNGYAMKLTPYTADIISFSLAMAEKTNGAFDITIFPILTAWGFATGSFQIPIEEEIETLLSKTGHEQVVFENGYITMPEYFQIDLGAIAKGYTLDIITELLNGYDITSALINLGGDIKVIGSRPDGNRWRIGINNPFGNGNIGVLEITDRALTSSGNYGRYFIGEDGNQYGHIIDPSTGRPVQNELISVVVIGADGKICDALSTAFFVMGVKQSINFWRENDGFDFILLTNENELFITEELKNDFTLNKNYMYIRMTVITK